jgi:hypothetical protein
MVEARSGKTVEQEWLDVMLAEAITNLRFGPARCKRETWLEWDDLDPAAQIIMVSVLSRYVTSGDASVVEERVGDYQVRYADASLFEGRHPQFFTDNEEVMLSRIAGCGGGLYSLSVGGIPIHDMSRPEDMLDQGGPLPDYGPWEIEPPSHANGWVARKVLKK